MSTAAQASWRPSGTYTGVRDFIIKTYGIDPDSAEYLSPSPLRAAEIQNIPQAAAVIKDCIDKGMPVKIVGDYDADGITSTAILIKLFKFFGANVKAVIPRRFSDGYGIAERMVEGVTGSLIVTVDNGISGAEVIKKAKANGNTVVILDHHLAPEIMPEADAIVDPHIPGDRSSFREYCGAGLSLKMTEYMCMGQPPQQTFRLLLDTTVLAMIGTIADVVVLLGDNRRIVKAGLGIINDPKYFEMLSPGIRELPKLAGEPYDESSIAFTIAPILNAPGRLYDGGSSSSLKALLATDMNDALRFAAAMNSINGNRKELVAQWYKVAAEEAAAQAESSCVADAGDDDDEIDDGGSVSLAEPTRPKPIPYLPKEYKSRSAAASRVTEQSVSVKSDDIVDKIRDDYGNCEYEDNTDEEDFEDFDSFDNF